jgi:hypothetical protein
MDMRKASIALGILLVVLLVAACSSAPANTPDAAPEEAESEPTPVPPTPEPTATPEPMQLPDTPVTALLGVEPNTTYKVDLPSFQALAVEEGDLPAAPGQVEARWYKSGERYVVAYSGLNYIEGDFLCPGNSIFTASGFLHVSNAPTDEGACEGFPTLTSDPDVGPRVCQGELVYMTAIPSSLQGMLFGTLEALTEDGDLVGLTSSVQSTEDIPELDLDEFCG